MSILPLCAVAFLSLIIVSLSWPETPTPDQPLWAPTGYIPTGNATLLFARYNEPMSWWRGRSHLHTVILDKQNITNGCYEASSYLWYILQNYDSLPSIMLFFHAQEWGRHRDPYSTSHLIDRLNFTAFQESELLYLPMNLQQSNYIPVEGDTLRIMRRNWINTFHFPEDDLPTDFPVYCCAEFLVKKEAILQWPISTYRRLYHWCETRPAAEHRIFFWHWILDWISPPSEVVYPVDSKRAGVILEYLWHYLLSGTRETGQALVDPTLCTLITGRWKDCRQ